jgi:hypothetical protein
MSNPCPDSPVLPLPVRMAIWLAVVGCAVCFGLGVDFERPKALCLGVSAALLLPRAWVLWRVEPLPKTLRRVVLLLAALTFASAYFSSDLPRALVGSLERSQGLLVLIAAAILALARIPVHALIAPIQLSTVIVGLWAILQITGFERAALAPFVISGSQDSGWGSFAPGRAFASLGNPTALGQWLALALPVLLFALANASTGNSCAEKKNRGGYLALGLGAIAIAISGTRAAWLALALVAAWTVFAQRAPINRSLLLGLALSISVAGASLAWQRPQSIEARIALWQAGLTSQAQLWRAEQTSRLLLGYGPDLHSAALSMAMPKGALEPGRSADRAHEWWLDQLLSFGYLGLLARLGLLVLIVRAHRSLNNRATRGAAIGLCAVFIAWQFGFSLTAEKALSALLLGGLFASRTATSIPARHTTRPVMWTAALLAIGCTLSFAPVGWLNLERFAPWRTPERAYQHFQQAQAAIVSGEYKKAQAQLLRAHQLDVTRADYRRALQSMNTGPKP